MICSIDMILLMEIIVVRNIISCISVSFFNTNKRSSQLIAITLH